MFRDWRKWDGFQRSCVPAALGALIENTGSFWQAQQKQTGDAGCPAPFKRSQVIQVPEDGVRRLNQRKVLVLVMTITVPSVLKCRSRDAVEKPEVGPWEWAGTGYVSLRWERARLPSSTCKWGSDGLTVGYETKQKLCKMGSILHIFLGFVF